MKGEVTADPRPALDDEERDVDAVGIICDLLLLHYIRTHSSDVAQSLVGFAAGLSQRDQLLLREYLHAEALEKHADSNDGNEGEDNQGKLPVVGEDCHQADYDLAQRDKPAGQVGRDHALDDLSVRAQAIEQLADAHGVEERNVLSEHVPQHQCSEAATATRGGDGVKNGAEEGEHAVADIDAHKVQRELGDLPHIKLSHSRRAAGEAARSPLPCRC